VNYGDIIKRSWHITWRYKALWVLGIFAGVSGCQASGGSRGGSSGGTGGDFGRLGSEFSRLRLERFFDRLVELLPLLIAIGLALLLIGLVIAVFSIAARGGLVVGANAADEGRRATLTELWGAGFGRFWALLGLDLLLKLPVLLVSMVMLAGVLVPIVTAVRSGRDPGAGVIAPICGSPGLGIPLLLAMGFVLGIMHLLGLRYLMLGRQGVIESAGNGWRFLRARFKDTFLLWLINVGLNIAASFALAIPMIVLGIGIGISLVAAAAQGEWAVFAWIVAVLVAFVWAIGIAYNAVWGTFTSALWTVFFRDVSGMSAAAIAWPPSLAAPPPAPIGPPPAPAGYEPAAPAYPGDYPPAPPLAGPPMAPPSAEFPGEPPAPPADA